MPKPAVKSGPQPQKKIIKAPPREPVSLTDKKLAEIQKPWRSGKLDGH